MTDVFLLLLYINQQRVVKDKLRPWKKKKTEGKHFNLV